jgi:hypothetical protein
MDKDAIIALDGADEFKLIRWRARLGCLRQPDNIRARQFPVLLQLLRHAEY